LLCNYYNDLRLLMTPHFRREIGVGVSLVLALLAALCGSSEDAAGGLPNLSCSYPTNEGPSRVPKQTVVLFALLIV